MHIIKLKLRSRSYDIAVGSNILEKLGGHILRLAIGRDAYIITNAPIKKIYGDTLAKTLKASGINLKFRLIPDSEKSKSFLLAHSILKDISDFDKRRSVFVVAFGGGVVGDLAGFIASIYKRGIPYIQIPTTLLAQVDSSIGGKTGVDLECGKNLIGAFYQPKFVLSDVSIIKTLPLRQLKSGISEIIKYAIIKDPGLFSYLERKYPELLRAEARALEFVVRRCSEIKARIVEVDEREKKGLRTILNYGHTLGHALEAASRYKRYNHGEAVAIGMLLALDISSDLGLLNLNIARRIETLIQKTGLPAKISGVPLTKIIQAHYHDKKFRGSKNRFVLVERIGRVKIVEDIGLTAIKNALKKRAVG